MRVLLLGAATNDKVHKFETERIKDDIRWLSENGALEIFIVDANWGMAPRDVELTEHIVACSKETGCPIIVYMAAAKNKPERMAQIVEILVQGGLMACPPISLQTLDGQALQLIDRQNIKERTYTELQAALRERNISSYVELIWPLPGETLESFRAGVTRLCRLRADSLVVYPHLLLHNTPISRNQELYGIQKRELASQTGEAEVVTATSWVNPEQCLEGHWLYYAIHSLYNLRGLYYLAHYLDSAGIESFAGLFTRAGHFFRDCGNSGIAAYFCAAMERVANFDAMFSGEMTRVLLHQSRAEFDELLLEFAAAQP